MPSRTHGAKTHHLSSIATIPLVEHSQSDRKVTLEDIKGKMCVAVTANAKHYARVKSNLSLAVAICLAAEHG